MTQTVVGLFDDRDDAQSAVKDFLNHKFAPDRVSIVTTDTHGEFVQQPVTKDGNQAGSGAAAGLVSGAIVGGIFGLLVGVGVLLIPGVGILAAGPVAMTLAGAGIGAVGGGLLGALIGLGIPDHQVSTYAEAIRRGGCLLAVEVDDANIVDANDIMRKHGAVDIHQRAAYYQSQGFTQYDPKAPVYTQQQIADDRANMHTYNQNYQSQNFVNSPPPPIGAVMPVSDESVRTRYDSVSRQNLTYQQWEPAYRYGWQIGQNPQYHNFNQTETGIRQTWEQTNPGTYDLYRDAIHSGFEDAFARRSGPKMM